MARERKFEAYDYAERVLARLPAALQAELERAGLTEYGLQQTSGISREMIGRVARKDANPSICVLAQMSHGLDLRLSELVRMLEDTE